MKRFKVEIPFENIEGKQSCEVQLIQHRDKTESLFCRTVMENGRKVELVAKLHRLVKTDCSGNEWDVSCLGMSTHSSNTIERWCDAIDMFRFWLSVFTGMIRSERAKVEVSDEYN